MRPIQGWREWGMVVTLELVWFAVLASFMLFFPSQRERALLAVAALALMARRWKRYLFP